MIDDIWILADHEGVGGQPCRGEDFVHAAVWNVQFPFLEKSWRARMKCPPNLRVMDPVEPGRWHITATAGPSLFLQEAAARQERAATTAGIMHVETQIRVRLPARAFKLPGAQMGQHGFQGGAQWSTMNLCAVLGMCAV